MEGSWVKRLLKCKLAWLMLFVGGMLNCLGQVGPTVYLLIFFPISIPSPHCATQPQRALEGIIDETKWQFIL